MKKITIYALLFLISASFNACKKEDSTMAPTTADCKISKVEYGGGQYDTFTFNNLGQVAQYDGYFKDETGKIVRGTTTYTYDANGLLSNAKYGDGSGQEKYTYINGALSSIEVFDDKNVSIYKITVTTDANKRIIGMKDSNNFSNKLTRDALGNFIKAEVFDEKNNLVLREEISSYDGKKNWRSSLSGWPLDVTSSYESYIFFGGSFNEPSGGSNDDKLYSAYDDNGNYTGKLNLVNNFSITKQFNSKGFPTQAILKDGVNSGNNSTRTYSYSDCQ